MRLNLLRLDLPGRCPVALPGSASDSSFRSGVMPQIGCENKGRFSSRHPDQRIYRPLIARAITSRWISLVPSKMV
jgi:hypothetical protein